MMNNGVKKICALLTVSGMICSSSAFAFEAMYYPENDSVKVNGENKADTVAVVVMPYNYTVDELTEELVNSMSDVIFKSIPTGGKYEDEILLSDSMADGKYRISENIGGNTKDSVFIRMNGDKTEELIEAVNGADKYAFLMAVKQFITNLSLDLSESAVSEIAEKLYTLNPKSGYTTESFYKNLVAAEGLFSFKYSKISLEDYFEEYAVCLDADLIEAYNSFTESQKNEAENCASGIDFLKGSISDTLSEVLFIAKVHSATNFTQLRTSVEKYREKNSMSLPKYDSLNQDYLKNNVFINLFDDRNKINNAEDIASCIETLAGTEKNNANKLPSSTGGGGGSMSGSSMSFSPNTVTPNENNNKEVFNDISTHWAKADIEKMNGLGIINGFEDKTFRPDNKVTRAEFVKMLVNVLNIPSGGDCSFDDISDSDWFKQCVVDAVNAGIVSGVTATQFAPYNELTRQDAAVMVYRSIKEKLTDNAQDINYNDENSISDYALGAIKALSTAGIVNGSDGNFNPKNGITRAEAVTLLLRVYGIV